MLELVLQMPPENCSHDRGHKFPFVVNEIIGQELCMITEKFFILVEEKTEVAEMNTQEGEDDVILESEDFEVNEEKDL